MPAYVIADVQITDPDAYSGYTAGVPASVARFGGRFLVRGGSVERLEGDWDPNRVVVIEFPDMDSLRAWWDSDEYRALAEIRRGASRGSLLAVDGFAG